MESRSSPWVLTGQFPPPTLLSPSPLHLEVTIAGNVLGMILTTQNKVAGWLQENGCEPERSVILKHVVIPVVELLQVWATTELTTIQTPGSYQTAKQKD